MVFMEVSLFIFKQEGYLKLCLDRPEPLEFTLRLPRLLLTDIALNDLLLNPTPYFPNTNWGEIPTPSSRLS